MQVLLVVLVVVEPLVTPALRVQEALATRLLFLHHKEIMAVLRITHLLLLAVEAAELAQLVEMPRHQRLEMVVMGLHLLYLGLL